MKKQKKEGKTKHTIGDRMENNVWLYWRWVDGNEKLEEKEQKMIPNISCIFLWINKSSFDNNG